MSMSIIMEGRKSGSWEKDNTIGGFLNIMLCTIFFQGKMHKNQLLIIQRNHCYYPKPKRKRNHWFFFTGEFLDTKKTHFRQQ